MSADPKEPWVDEPTRWRRALNGILMGECSRSTYFLAGTGLFLLKFVIDSVISLLVFERPWSPYRYVVQDEKIFELLRLEPLERAFYLTMLLAAIPFMAIGVVLTIRRLRSAGLPLGLSVFFFLPAPLNLIFYLTLAAWPARTSSPLEAPGPSLDGMTFDQALPSPREVTFDSSDVPARSNWRARWIALVATVPASVLLCIVSAHVFSSYGWGVFLGLPFVGSMACVLVYSLPERRTIGQCLVMGLIWSGFMFVALLLLALEGAICLLMLAPLALPLVLLGAWLGYMLQWQSRPKAGDLGRLFGVLLLFLPSLIGAESLVRDSAPVFVGRSVIDIDAPPERVWRHVVSFSKLPPPDDWIFATGIAYPIRAEIVGIGVGAERYCIFSTGAFIEPITVWDEPRLLRFDVTENPPPMKEWNPILDIHPPHLDSFLVARQGEFRLIELPDGRTRLVGTTWYQHHLWPSRYWQLWSDTIIKRIHGQVLRHVKRLAESEDGHVDAGHSGNHSIR
jgi:hypothetical protein